VLKLSLAKREEAKPRRIEIKANGGNQPKTIETSAENKTQSAKA
jgi:hypothetical protein